MRIRVSVWSILSTINNNYTASELSEIIFPYSVRLIGLSDVLVVFVVRYNYEVFPGAASRDKKNAVLEYKENINTSSSFHNMFLSARGRRCWRFHDRRLLLLAVRPPLSSLPQD